MTKLFNVNTDNNTDTESHTRARTVSVMFLKPHTKRRHNRREDDKRESPHCDTDTIVPWKTSPSSTLSPSEWDVC